MAAAIANGKIHSWPERINAASATFPNKIYNIQKHFTFETNKIDRRSTRRPWNTFIVTLSNCKLFHCQHTFRFFFYLPWISNGKKIFVLTYWRSVFIGFVCAHAGSPHKIALFSRYICFVVVFIHVESYADSSISLISLARWKFW